jgi:hypothetical protein
MIGRLAAPRPLGLAAFTSESHIHVAVSEIALAASAPIYQI